MGHLEPAATHFAGCLSQMINTDLSKFDNFADAVAKGRQHGTAILVNVEVAMFGVFGHLLANRSRPQDKALFGAFSCAVIASCPIPAIIDHRCMLIVSSCSPSNRLQNAFIVGIVFVPDAVAHFTEEDVKLAEIKEGGIFACKSLRALWLVVIII